MKIIVSTLAALALLSGIAGAAISFTGVPLLEDFIGFDGTIAPAGWDADGFSSGAGFSEMRGSSSGEVGTGGTYAFDIGGGNVALGVQPGGSDFTSGFYELEVVNDSGAAVNVWGIEFKSYSLNDQERGNSFNFSYSTDGSLFTDVASGSFTSTTATEAIDAPAWTLEVDFADSISASVANGGSLFLRWTGDDVDGSGSRDEFALDDVVIGAIPEPTGFALLGLTGLALILRRRR